MSATPRTDQALARSMLPVADSDRDALLRLCREMEMGLAEANRALSKGNAWVSTDERKPAFDQTVLGFWPASTYCAASYESITFHEGDDGGPDFWLDVFAGQEDEPTHWMPLPSAPEAK